MLKLLFWGLIGYVVYRYFQIKKELKEGRYRAYMQHKEQAQQHHASAPNARDDEGEFIDYEEVKK
ncbi:MAG: hypothetical protein IPN76_04865 [Saprospiraceae bacterium]|nr:hypothetical protein [Saprospiraceae bacterium]